ncbi:hypothetical protein [Micromonospora sp. WMMD980]|uniref:hypothetical protein n=1 Tax=Micromonospora sp. WMMD980 TaxID=3016088 RepID=UPI0024164A76|nr:hypothetical protein [Micromonospora sp. WMMD980]MDG4804945.1 hypothetical protein [Micromonospora sp. WMMD980]
MTRRPLATTGVALVAVLGLGLTGCADRPGAETSADRPATTTSATPAADAAGELTAAIARLNEQSMRVKLESAMITASGVSDPQARTMQATLNLPVFGKASTLVIGKDTWVRFDGALGERLGSGKKWMHMATGKGIMPVDDPGGVKKLLSAVVDVRRDGDRGFSGTLDYTRTGVDAKALAAAGDKAKALPFTAAVDAEGRLTTFTMDMTPINASYGTMTASYSDFGAPVKLSRPAAGDTVEAPAEIAKAFSGAGS